MENRRQNFSCETQLPEEMIQHIQSFLSGKEAARTTILSKSWYNAWLTRPNLALFESNFPTRLRPAFLKLAEKTMQRYNELNLKIHTFGLIMYGDSCKRSPANEMIAKALKLGATDLYIIVELRPDDFVLPDEVLQSQTLVTLSFAGANIDLHNSRKVRCSRLKSLSLFRVRIEGNTLWGFISMFPLIEKLVLYECYGMRVNEVIHVCDFPKLRELSVEGVGFEWLLIHISRFPCLKKLTVGKYSCCHGFREIQICSNSLECICFTHESMLRANFDIPRIRKLKVSTSKYIPFLSFKTTSREWESDIIIRDALRFDSYSSITRWFQELREFLFKLSPSKISLSLTMVIGHGFSDVTNTTANIIPRLTENLTLLVYAPSSLHSAILENLFRSCRPNFITLYWLPPIPVVQFFVLVRPLPEVNNDFTKHVCDTLEKKVSDNGDQNMSTLPLEEVTVEFYENDVIEGRRLLPWKTLLAASTNSGKNEMEVRLQLQWR